MLIGIVQSENNRNKITSTVNMLTNKFFLTVCLHTNHIPNFRQNIYIDIPMCRVMTADETMSNSQACNEW